ncbi:hypothetical protein MRX96_030955 [Rhipicephalus microplus]
MQEREERPCLSGASPWLLAQGLSPRLLSLPRGRRHESRDSAHLYPHGGTWTTKGCSAGAERFLCRFLHCTAFLRCAVASGRGGRGPDIGRHWERPALNRASAPSCRFWCNLLGRSKAALIFPHSPKRNEGAALRTAAIDSCHVTSTKSNTGQTSAPGHPTSRRPLLRWCPSPRTGGILTRSARLINTTHAPSGPKSSAVRCSGVGGAPDSTAWREMAAQKRAGHGSNSNVLRRLLLKERPFSPPCCLGT